MNAIKQPISAMNQAIAFTESGTDEQKMLSQFDRFVPGQCTGGSRYVYGFMVS